MRLAALFSGGKDSTYSILLAERMGHRVEILLTFLPKSMYSHLFHYPNLHLTPLQAEAMCKKQILIPVEERVEEEALDKALADFAGSVDGLVAGAIASRYQRDRMAKAAQKHGLEVITPLWNVDPDNILQRLLTEGFSILVVAVAAEGLGEGWLGRIIDERAVDDLSRLRVRYGVHPAGEGGEMETLVLDCPLFCRRLEPRRVEKIWRGSHGYLIVHEAVLVEKI